MNIYLLLKSLHLIAVISWMAGLLYLPRIFVYHSENNNEIITSVFKIMEKKLFFYIMTPAMLLSWLFGLVLIHEIGFQELSSLWLQLKIIFVILLTVYHFYLGFLLNKFKFNQNDKTSKFYRYINEIPTLLLILIVFIVVFKPILG
ncbi:protoporphyrinogen oxidase HemJ [Pelagibacterales bacterium SAG-MED39]|nr:protoporphyrinogen oxidase HemJ [Pelagibacterales bacterium SAG-MED39]